MQNWKYVRSLPLGKKLINLVANCSIHTKLKELEPLTKVQLWEILLHTCDSGTTPGKRRKEEYINVTNLDMSTIKYTVQKQKINMNI
jgi:hypothetical protein